MASLGVSTLYVKTFIYWNDSNITKSGHEPMNSVKPHVRSPWMSSRAHPALTQDTTPPIFGQSECQHHPLHLVQAHTEANNYWHVSKVLSVSKTVVF